MKLLYALKGKNNNNNKAEKGVLSAFCIGFFNAFVFSLLKKNYACAFTFMMIVGLDNID